MSWWADNTFVYSYGRAVIGCGGSDRLTAGTGAGPAVQGFSDDEVEGENPGVVVRVQD